MAVCLCVYAGLPLPTGVHRDTRSPSGDDRRFLANVVGTQLHHRSNVDETARAWTGQYLRRLNVLACIV